MNNVIEMSREKQVIRPNRLVNRDVLLADIARLPSAVYLRR